MSPTTTNNATAPAEARGLARDEVRLLVCSPSQQTDTVFHQLPTFLRPGDLVVVNTSATLAASVDGRRRDGSEVEIHFSSAVDDGSWIIEVRPPGLSFGPLADVQEGEWLGLPGCGGLRVLETLPDQRRLHRADIEVPVAGLLERYGRPIAYGYIPQRWPLRDYQTLFADEPGSAEMPSAARPFTPTTVTDLAIRGRAAGADRPAHRCLLPRGR
jgi:S-adenosylmethionine:tRNA ribosyltransferase-isomerase